MSIIADGVAVVNQEFSTFADTIYRQKYAMPGEEWADTAYRVASNVVGPYFPELVDEIAIAIENRKFMPAGRYLYATGRPIHQVNNCFMLRPEDSREGWAEHMHKTTSVLMTGGGMGAVYSDIRPRGSLVKGMGGICTGPVSLMQMTNEAGRHIMQGGSRRAALWAGLHWNHPDIFEFICAKDWSDDVRAMKEKDFNFPATLDMTNISVILDDDFFAAYENESNPQHDLAHQVYRDVVDHMLETGEPGFSVDVGANAKENLRNPCPVAGHTHVLTDEGYVPVADIVGTPTTVWTGVRWAEDVVFKETNSASPTLRVSMSGGRVIDADPTHPFMVERYHGAGTHRELVSVDRVPASDLRPGDILQVSLPAARLIPTKRVKIDLEGWTPYRESTIKVLSVEPAEVQPVYCANVNYDEHTFVAEGVVISNCEITSSDDSDVCNLGSINLARVDDIWEFKRLVEICTIFLLCGTLYSSLPYEKVGVIRQKNRRLGLGLMGIHEWLLKRDYPYAPNAELGTWLSHYANSTNIAARYADRLGISRPIKTRAIAPTGSIGILAETTSGIEPQFATAYKRRYLKGTKWHYQYVIDATARRLIDSGVDPAKLETAYDLAKTPERRVAMQAWLQKYVDHAISSTINLPAVDEQEFTPTEFGNMLYRYLPQIRGITVYPDGSRGGQPLNVVSYEEAINSEGIEFEEFGADRSCVSGVCGV